MVSFEISLGREKFRLGCDVEKVEMCLEPDERSEGFFCNSVQYRNYCWERIYNNKKNWISMLSNVAHHPVTTTELNQIGV